MRRRVESNGVVVQAIAGSDGVFFGFDLDEAAREGCLGFAVHRTDHTEGEQYPMFGFKTFRSVVPFPSLDATYSTFDHPIQSLIWGDYSVKPAHDYTYRVIPRYGTPKDLTSRDGVEATIDVSTSDPGQGVHGVYFNRGIAASQAYVRKFGDSPAYLPPDKAREAYAWLSRGLLEALVRFIAQANSDRYALRAAVYQFTQGDVIRAFRDAHLAGADVRIVYHGDGSEGIANDDAVADGLIKSLTKRRTNADIAHNKFIVLGEQREDGSLEPLQVWTGSTNLSEGGIFGHSNVGHVVRDPEIARRYLAFWEALSEDPGKADLRDWVGTNDPFDATEIESPDPAVHLILSPRSGLAPLEWYAERFGNAKVMSAITPAFGLTTLFEEAIADVHRLTYVLANIEEENQDAWADSKWVQVAIGKRGGPESLDRWAQEHLSGLNAHALYIHTKILLIDPLSADPTVVSGTANFSDPSTDDNDENMLVIRGDLDVADTYFVEFNRLFNHFYARYWAWKLSEGATDDASDDDSFLGETPAWLEPYFADRSPKNARRVMLSENVAANT